MKLINPINRPQIVDNKKLNSTYSKLEKLIEVLLKRELPKAIIIAINKDIEALNQISDSEKGFRSHVLKAQARIIQLLEKELKLVAKNHYQNLWLALGMAVFGVPMGVAFGLSLDNMAYLGIGLPLGMSIGLAIGVSMDKKALDGGRQLDLECE